MQCDNDSGRLVPHEALFSGSNSLDKWERNPIAARKALSILDLAETLSSHGIIDASRDLLGAAELGVDMYPFECACSDFGSFNANDIYVHIAEEMMGWVPDMDDTDFVGDLEDQLTANLKRQWRQDDQELA